MRTPLQELILKLADKQDEHHFNTDYDDGVRRGLALAIINARELLKKEQSLIEDSYTDGIDFRNELEIENYSGSTKDGNQYYNKTFK